MAKTKDMVLKLMPLNLAYVCIGLCNHAMVNRVETAF